MLLRDHPELITWPPGQNAIACPGDQRPTEKEVPKLIIQNVMYREPSRIIFILRYGAGTCDLSKDFTDGQFAVALYGARNNLIGKSLQEAGDVDIS